jgi:hypothetical protein
MNINPLNLSFDHCFKACTGRTEIELIVLLCHGVGPGLKISIFEMSIELIVLLCHGSGDGFALTAETVTVAINKTTSKMASIFFSLLIKIHL